MLVGLAGRLPFTACPPCSAASRRPVTDVARPERHHRTPTPSRPPTATSSPSAKAYTPSKKDLGKVTPKRKAGGRRAAEPPPANRREALRRMRQKQREARAEARAGMMAGKEEYLFPRDKGPERALVRDIVDSRRNVATYFLPGALVVLIGSSAGHARGGPVRREHVLVLARAWP